MQKWENTPLHLAAERGQTGAYHLIVENIVNKNPFISISDTMRCKCTKREKMCSFSSVTPLHLAAKNGNISICKLITEHVLDKNPTASHIDLEEELTEHRISTRDQGTPLHLAAYNGHFSVCELIINDISRKNPKDEDGWTPLHSAAQNGHLSVCKLILSNIRKSNAYTCNPYDKSGNSPFKLATQFCHEEVKTTILEFALDAEERKNKCLEEKKKAAKKALETMSPYERFLHKEEEKEDRNEKKLHKKSDDTGQHLEDPIFNFELMKLILKSTKNFQVQGAVQEVQKDLDIQENNKEDEDTDEDTYPDKGNDKEEDTDEETDEDPDYEPGKNTDEDTDTGKDTDEDTDTDEDLDEDIDTDEDKHLSVQDTCPRKDSYCSCSLPKKA